MEETERVVAYGLAWLKLAIELTGAVVIALGCLTTTAEIIKQLRGRLPVSYTFLRLRLGRFLAIGLEYQLAADIIGTAIAPTWEQLGKLAAIATIRTALNFFLGLELRQEAAASTGEQAAPLPIQPAGA